MGNFTYVPAEVPGSCNMNENIYALFGEVKQELGWWRPTSIFRYPYVLISAHYGKGWKNLRQDMEIPDDAILIGDSGGFQNMSLIEWKGQKIHIDPTEVFEWQKRNCDIAFPLDYPPFEDSESAWQKSLKISKDNFQIAEDLYSEYLKNLPVGRVTENFAEAGKNEYEIRVSLTAMKLYNVFQGYGYDKKRMDEWYDMAIKFKNMSATGWAFGCKPEAKPMLIAYQAMYMYHKGHKKNFHFLAVGGSRTIPVMAYLAKYIDNITSDSSSWAQGAMQRKYFLPGYFGKFELFFGNHNKSEIKSLPCRCPVCQKVGNNIGLLSAQGSAPGGIISLHNLYQIIQFSRLCNSLKDDTEVYKTFVKKMFDEEVQKSIEFIDYSLEKGFSKACIKYRPWFHLQSSKLSTGKLLDY